MVYDLMPKKFWGLPATWMDEDEDFTIGSPSGLSISEDDNNVYVDAAMPGINPSDVEITFDKGTLWIKGEGVEKEEDKAKKFYRKATSSFSYRITVPGDVDLTKDPEAVSENGVMKIKFAKSPQTKPKKINVRVK